MYAGPAGRVAFLVGLLFGSIVGLRRVIGLAVGATLHCGAGHGLLMLLVVDG
jgi:hypothetical protein